MLHDLKFEGVDFADYPDFCDAYIASGKKDGRELSEDELEELNQDGMLVHEELLKTIF